ncbi:MAG: restriction endonuclease subunit S [Thalassospira sp.]|uniref:restriction endonuclease subunit S n=1 Tax=Thalassospira sp. TaxID=1912094 RepID=UPI0032F03F60
MVGAWPIKKIEELCDVTSSKRIYAKELTRSGVPFLKSKEIIDKVNGKVIHANALFISEERYQQIIAHSGALEEGDVLLTSRGTLGVPYVIRATDRFHFADGNLTWFRNFRGLNSKFLRYWLLSPMGKAQLQTAVIGAAQQAYTIASLKKMELSYPSIVEQNRIVAILSAYDDLIENNTRRIAILEEMARRLYEEWFVHFRFPGHEDATFIDTEDGRVPEGWNAIILDDLVEDIRQTIQPSQVDQSTPYVGLEHIPRRSTTLSEWGTAESVDSTKLVFRKGDILFGKIRPYFHKVCIAPIDGICSSDTILLRARKEEFSSIALCCTSSDAFVQRATQTSNGTKMPRANWNVLKKYLVAMPPEPILTKFNKLIIAIAAQTTNLMSKNRNLRAQRDLLLPKLISGEINVSKAEEVVGGEAA